MSEPNIDTSKVVWFMAGMAIGATVALLFAPASGAETRRAIGRRAEEGREVLSETGRDLLDKGRDLYDKGRKIADEAAEMFDRGKKLVQS
jgi:gas vesicle protein